MPAQQSNLDHVFILRFWHEANADADASPLWRARVTDVNTGRQFHTDGLESALSVVRSLMIGRSKSGADT
ncbi:hypothetical protein ACU8MG_25380 (plasmid) [Rhizobium leguminosarum]